MATLAVDDHIELSSLKQPFSEPPFDDRGLAQPEPAPAPQEVRPLGMLAALVPGARAKHEAALADAQTEHAEAVAAWEGRETTREKALDEARASHEREVAESRHATEVANAAIDEFEERLDAADPAAIVDYLGMAWSAARVRRRPRRQRASLRQIEGHAPDHGRQGRDPGEALRRHGRGERRPRPHRHRPQRGRQQGILVTTSGYGKASFEFAEGKPLELLDGSNLLHLLREHAGVEARIDPPEDWVDPEGVEVK